MISRSHNVVFSMFLLVSQAVAFSAVPSARSAVHQWRRQQVGPLKMAQGGAPQYTKRPASIVSNKEVGRDSYLIRVKAEDGEPVDYQPGNVLALEIFQPEKEEWTRGPYTVSRATDDSFDVLYKVVGKKTQLFSAAPVGSQLQFGGKFKVPILEGIDTEGLERVVGISTGVGIGPLIGYAEHALSTTNDYKIDLYVAFRKAEDICCADALDELVQAHPDRFSWTPILSSEQGRLSTLQNLKLIAQGTPAGATHYHLVGNGSMVNEWTAGLAQAGVPEDRVTLEMYFNHKETPRAEAVAAIGEALKEVAMV